MSSKKLFDKGKSYKVLSSVDPDSLSLDAESYRNIKAIVQEKNRFVPNVDFSDLANYARYGSAKKYYESAFDRVSNEYPYDGSSAEVVEFYNSSSYLDLYILENEYPKTTGYVNLSSEGWGSLDSTFNGGDKALGWGKPATLEYIKLIGGPHTASGGTINKPVHSYFTSSNIYDSDIYDTEGALSMGRQGTRESNLKFDLARGVTTEFWIKKEDWNTSLTEKEVIFDLWNNKATSSAAQAYGRLLIYMTGSGNHDLGGGGSDPFRVHLASGSHVWDMQFGKTTVTTASLTDWNHVAFSFYSSSVNERVEASFYFNGSLSETTASSNFGDLSGTPRRGFEEVTGSLMATIGALQTAPSGNAYTDGALTDWLGAGKLSASLDEFRYWKSLRTHAQIGKNYFRQVYGGTNTDISNTELGFYYKFNEGITGTSSLDSVVLDYSGRITNGKWQGYPAGIARNTGSAIVSASAAPFEAEDPIIYTSHPEVVGKRDTLVTSGSAYDYQNNSSIYYTLPSWIIEEDDDNGELINLTQIIGSYFDTLHSQIAELPKLKDVSYVSASQKPYPFSGRALESMGIAAPEILVDSNILEQIKKQSESEPYNRDLTEVKNLIYQNIYNNLVYIFKSKGTEKSFRNVVRCYGVDDELIKINLYGNNVKHKIRENAKATVVKKKYADFNNPKRFDATITHAPISNVSETEDVTYVSGSTTGSFNWGKYLSSTAEIDVIFPKKFSIDDTSYFATNFVTSSIFGCHKAALTGTDTGDYKWSSESEDRNFEIYAVRTSFESRDAYFLFKDRAGNFSLTSSIFQNIYDNQRWNLAVRVKHEKYPQSDYVSGSWEDHSNVDDKFVLELYGVNSDLGQINNEFLLTASLSTATLSTGHLASDYAGNARRYYLGAHRLNFTGAVQQRSDVKIGSFRHWGSYLNDTEIKSHAKDVENYGVVHPYRSTYLNQNYVTGTHIPKIETLALHWGFNNINSSDAAGNFTVHDLSSGSIRKITNDDGTITEIHRYPKKFGEVIGNQYGGKGYNFQVNDSSSVSVEYVQSLKQVPPEVVTSYDMTNIVDFDDEIFERDSRSINHFFAIEKSMYQTVSEEMLNMFGTIAGFNNLIGEPVNRYRQEYKDLGKLRNLFFDKVQNTPDLDKYVDYYKWIDSSLSILLKQLIPASANTSDDIRTMVESHVLERHKYHSKFPTLELKPGELITGISGINKFDPYDLPNWRFAHAPVRDTPIAAVNATATITVADGDAASGMTEKESIVITSEDGTEKTYVVVDDNATTVATGDILAADSDTGASTAGSALVGGIAVAINLTGTASTQNAFLVQLKAAIEHENGHNGKITVSAVPTEANGAQLITLTQDTVGVDGNRAITDDISQTTIVGFSGGVDAKVVRDQNSNTLWWAEHAERTHPSLKQASSGVNNSRSAIFEAKRSSRIRRETTPYKFTIESDPVDHTAKMHRGRKVVHKGINYPHNKDLRFYRAFIDGNPVSGKVDWRNFKEVPYTSDVINPNDKVYLPFGESSKGFKGSTFAPFNILSGTLSTGYNNFISKAARRVGFQIVNIHSDAYLPGGEEPMQGPFAEKHVGGYQHRHISLNTGSDDKTNRPEAWVITDAFADNDSIILKHPQFAYGSATPTAMRSRASLAKRPVNIRNIQITGSENLGNYTNIREVVQTSGRRNNNRQFVRSEGTSSNSIVSTTIASVVDTKLLQFTSSNHVISERFSAPGGPETSHGGLDAESGEYSVYNSLTYRNLSVRVPLRTMLSGVTAQFGFREDSAVSPTDYSGIGNFHKVHRNTSRRIEYSNAFTYENGLVATGSVRDNAFVTRPIPQSDLQYSWTTGSYEFTEPGGSRRSGGKMHGYAPTNFKVKMRSGYDTERSDGLVNAITFVSRSHVASTGETATFKDFVGLNTTILEPISSSQQTLGYPLSSRTSDYISSTSNFGTLAAGHALTALLAHRGDAYGFNTWNQIRTGEHPVARALREKHILSVENGDKQTFTGGRVLPAQRYGGFTQYRETPVTLRHKPIVQSIDNIVVESSYGNSISHFSNKDLDDFASPDSGEQMYDRVKDVYSEDPSRFNYLKYSETVYPAEKNVFDNKIRKRQDYQINFWNSSRTVRSSSIASKTSFGGRSIYSIWALDAPSQFSTMAIPNATNEVNDTPGELQNKRSQVHNGTKTAITASALYSLPHMMAATASVVSPSGILITETGSISDTDFGAPDGSDPTNVNIFGNMSVGAGAALWEAGTQAGRIENGTFVSSDADRKVPAYNSYEDYSEELRLRAKDFSIVPEFRISDHMKHYVKRNHGDFLAKNTGSFGIFGATGSSEYPTNSGESDFYDVYTNSDFLKYFEVVRADHEGIAKEHSITLKCKAAMKFLPYNGFYPAERTLQLATQYSASYASHVNYSGGDSTLENAKIRPFLEPLFAPGIVYNSVKSGIGMPYPVLTGSYQVQRLADYYAISGSAATAMDFRIIDFEAAVEPEKYLSDVSLVDMQPHPSASLNITASWNGQGDPLYSMMAHNFFGEVPEFFLPDGNMTTITSLPESDPRFGNAVSGTLYGMRVKMYRSMNRSRTFGSLDYTYPQDNPTDETLHETFTMYSRPSAFYHNVTGRNLLLRSQNESATYGDRILDSYNGYNWVATPPYYHGQAWVDILFRASSTKKYKLSEILSDIAATYKLRFDTNNISIGNDAGFYSNSALRDNILNLDKTIILDGKTRRKSVEYDPATGEPIVIKDDPSVDHVSYVIQPKWETPMFDFGDTGIRPITDAAGNLTIPTNGSEAVPRGMWHQFGLPPDSAEKGIFLQVTDIPQDWLQNHPGVSADAYNNGNVTSLVDLLGIDQDPHRLGEVSSKKLVSEAVIAVPFVEERTKKKFFMIEDGIFNDAVNKKLGMENSVQQMVEKLQNYVLPPRMDFITNKNIRPFAMYVFEFEHEFDKDDLTHIWQNLPPKSVSRMEEKESTVAHELLANELLGEEGMPSDIRWMVFKVKRRAVKNYFSKTASRRGDNLDDNRFKFEFEIAGRKKETTYSYNWPYDFFSLVEMVKIDAEVEFAPDSNSGMKYSGTTSKNAGHVHEYEVDSNGNGYALEAAHPDEPRIRHKHRIRNFVVEEQKSDCYPNCENIYGVAGVGPHDHKIKRET